MATEKINLDELRKAREELNVELGITTPKPKKKPVENTDVEKNTESEKPADKTFPAQNETYETMPDTLEEQDTETNEEQTEEFDKDETEKLDDENLESKISEITEKVESESNENSEKNDFDDILLKLLNDAPDDEVDDKYNVDEIASEVEKETELDSIENTEDEVLDEIEEEPIEYNEQFEAESSSPKIVKEKPQESKISLDNDIEKTAKTVSKEEKTVEKQDKKPKFDDDFELKPIYLPNIEINVETKLSKEKEEKQDEVVEKTAEEVNETEVEQPIVIDVEKPAAEPIAESNEKEEAINENALKKIEDAKFISLIRTKEFMGSDNLTCIYGVDEEKNVFCQNFKDFYNTAIFTDNDDNIFELFSSIIMSLLLKNTNYDVKFAICDAKIGGKLTVYNNLSYMFFDRVAESNREIIEALNEINLEIESRYKALAKAGSSSIEKFNSEMKKANIAPMPYLILFFNNYSRAYHLDDSNEINNKLSYILRFGRLVGVYANIVSFDENLVENINFNLQTRIAYKAELKETSITEIGEEGAENIAYNDEYIVKTLYSDKLIHLKAPKITQKEIELLIKNIEKK